MSTDQQPTAGTGDSTFIDRTAVVTGAASGIGRALALELLDRGATVLATDVGESELAELASTASGQLTTCVADVSSEASMQQMKAQADRDLGDVDFLFNNAGIGYNSEPTWKAPDSAVRWSYDVNVYGVLNGLRAFVPSMVRRGRGHIVNTASIGGFQVSARTDIWQQGIYASTKFAVVAISESLRIELGEQGIDVSVFAPSAVSTQIGDSGRHRPERFGGVTETASPPSMTEMLEREGITPQRAAEILLAGVATHQFYIFTDEALRARITERHAEIETAFAQIPNGRDERHA